MPWLIAVLLAWAGMGVAGAEQSVERGENLYRVYCVNCHGESGRGDGPTARLLKVRPADLTRLSRDNAGDFPAQRVRRQIDGREILPGHGRGRMPIWGLAFQEWSQDMNQEEQVQSRIDALVRYLETIQTD